MQLGLKQNSQQILQWLLQVWYVGLILGITRITVPALAEQEYGIAANSYLFLATFVIAFGVVKGLLNFVAGSLAESWGRKPVHLLGWLIALPIPAIISYAPSWNWVIFAMFLLGINQGLCWSMTQTAKLDIANPNQRGLTIGLNEFAGYIGVALGGLVTAYTTAWFGMREGLLYAGNIIVLLALGSSLLSIKESKPWLDLHLQLERTTALSSLQVFKRMTGTDKHLTAIVQAGCIEKFVDALVWIIWPVFLYQQTQDLALTGWIIAVYGLTWGVSQLFTGHWSDRIGRKAICVAGMTLCGLGVLALPMTTTTTGWIISALITGFGMALLYPNLSAAVVDASQPQWRAQAIGIYRFWRDIGYALGALGIGLVALINNNLEASFWFVGIAMLLSAGWLHVAWQQPSLD